MILTNLQYQEKQTQLLEFIQHKSALEERLERNFADPEAAKLLAQTLIVINQIGREIQDYERVNNIRKKA